ncbi:hypothetical protein GCT13_40040 [Paraburkholderia sp. CNPSo 3157]|uniref:Immunity protein 50 n=1 Tax=Paraburkholderia franconis TaxID=2654983 RepID=A0A7X1TKV6_9BURK|nr:Imm50 family immunity protein [Paraburkholderia franconis]MPW22828.1 hypothetical protein [Paraburkholderia franconis]
MADPPHLRLLAQLPDAELLSVSLRRHASGGKWQTDIELDLHYWGQSNPEWQGDDVHCKLAFVLEDVEGTEFTTENVSHPSWISHLSFSGRDDGRILVDLEPSSGFSLLLDCAVARVARVEPYLPERGWPARRSLQQHRHQR